VKLLDKEQAEIYAHELKSGVILNLFGLIYEAVNSKNGLINSNDETTKLKCITACEEAVNLFLESTNELTNCRLSSFLQKAEKDFLIAVSEYLFMEAPRDEMNMCMLCEMIRADYSDDNYESETDLDRLFKMLENKNKEHHSLEHYENYKKAGANRKKVLESISSRLRPLISFKVDDEKGIFEYCTKHELFEYAVSLIHNCTPYPEQPLSIMDKKNEIAFVTAALGFMMFEHNKENQTAYDIFKIFKNPHDFAKQLEDASKAIFSSQADRLNLSQVLKYWDICRDDVLSGKYDKSCIARIDEFFNFK